MNINMNIYLEGYINPVKGVKMGGDRNREADWNYLDLKQVHDNTLGGFGVYNEQREASNELSTDFDNPWII